LWKCIAKHVFGFVWQVEGSTTGDTQSKEGSGGLVDSKTYKSREPIWDGWSIWLNLDWWMSHAAVNSIKPAYFDL